MWKNQKKQDAGIQDNGNSMAAGFSRELDSWLTPFMPTDRAGLASRGVDNLGFKSVSAKLRCGEEFDSEYGFSRKSKYREKNYNDAGGAGSSTLWEQAAMDKELQAKQNVVDSRIIRVSDRVGGFSGCWALGTGF